MANANSRSLTPTKSTLTNSFSYTLVAFVFVLIMIISFVSGCATPNISRETQLSDDEGVLLTKVHANVRGIKISVYDENAIGLLPKAGIADDDYASIELWGKLVATVEQPIEYVRVVSVKGGRSFLGRLDRLNGYVKLEPQYFNIVPGVITYIGDLHLNWVGSGFGGHVQMSFSDAEEKTIAEAKEKFPWLFERYRYVKNMPEVKLETVQGFKEVKELKELKEKEKGQKNKNEDAQAK